MFKVSPALNTHACSRLRKFFWTDLATGFWGRSFQIIPSLVRRSSIVDGLLSSSFFSTRLQNCNAGYLRYQFNSETCRRRYLIDADGFIFQQDGAPAHTAHATQDWLHATAMTIAKHEWPPNSTDLNLLDYHVRVPCRKPITSWISHDGQVSHQQLYIVHHAPNTWYRRVIILCLKLIDWYSNKPHWNRSA